MDTLSERLRRAGEVVHPPEPALERLVLRRDRRRGNRRIASTIVALAVAGGGIGGALYGMGALVKSRTMAPVAPAAPADANPPPPLETGQYFYERTIRLLPHTYGLGGGRVTEETWWGPDGSGRREGESTTPYGLGPIDTWGRGEMPVEDLSELSTDPDVLADQLLERSAPGGASPQPPGTPGPGIGEDSATLWRAIGHLLEMPNAEPALRAALFEVAARISEVELLRDVVDPVGRQAIALQLPAEGGIFDLYFDPDTLQLLASVEDYGSGDMWYRIVESAGIVGSTEESPQGSQLLIPPPASPPPETKE